MLGISSSCFRHVQAYASAVASVSTPHDDGEDHGVGTMIYTYVLVENECPG